jgi:hypothetical protein
MPGSEASVTDYHCSVFGPNQHPTQAVMAMPRRYRTATKVTVEMPRPVKRSTMKVAIPSAANSRAQLSSRPDGRPSREAGSRPAADRSRFVGCGACRRWLPPSRPFSRLETPARSGLGLNHVQLEPRNLRADRANREQRANDKPLSKKSS